MARVHRTGFEYTRMDLNFFSDIKVRRAIRLNPMAPTVYLVLLTYILKESYYLAWDDDIPFLVSETLGVSEDEVKAAFDALVQVDLINGALLRQEGIVTSRGIQKQYNSLSESTHRKILIDENSPFSLLGGNDEKTPKSGINSEKSAEIAENENKLGGNDEKTPKSGINSEKSTRKKESKESKENYSSCCSSFGKFRSTSDEEKQQQSFVFYFFLKNWKEPKKEFFEKFLPWNNSGDRRWAEMNKDQREAALLLWQQKPIQQPRFAGEFLSMWEQIVGKLAETAPSEIVWAALDDKLSWRRDPRKPNAYILYCKESLSQFIEHHMDILKPIFYSHYDRMDLSYVYTDKPNSNVNT